MTSRTYLYRVFGAEDELLYVGVTERVSPRMTKHAATTEWWPDARAMKLDFYDDRAEALQAEMEVIRAEKPLHNIFHLTGPKSGRDSLTRTNTDMASVLGPQIKAARQGLGLNQDGLARKLDIPLSALNRYERGRTFPSVPQFMNLCSVLGFDPGTTLQNVWQLAESEQARRLEGNDGPH